MTTLLFVSVTFGLLTVYSTAFNANVDFEAENGTYTGLLRTRQDGKMTVYLDVNDRVTNIFRIYSDCSISVADVVYFNDGGSDKVNVTLGDEKIGFFMTESPEVGHPPGYLWNILRNSRAVGTTVQLEPMFHLVTVAVNQTDCRGVEIDKITLHIVCDQEPRVEGGTPQQPESEQGLSIGAGQIVGIVSAALGVPGCIVAVTTICGCCFKRRQRRDGTTDPGSVSVSNAEVVNVVSVRTTGKNQQITMTVNPSSNR